MSPTATSLPSLVTIEYLHRRQVAEEAEFHRIFTHCQIVWAIAEQLIDAHHLIVDRKLVRAGALLHDIGVYRLHDDEAYVRHGILGQEVLKREGFDVTLQRFAACHTGVGITRHEIEATGLPLPLADYIPQTNEERLVAYADKFHSKFPMRFNSIEEIREDLSRYGVHKAEQFDAMMLEFGMPDIEHIARQFDQNL